MSSRLGSQIKEIVNALNDANISFALIGGLALASHKVVRATQDIDLLIDSEDVENVNNLLLELGYECIYQSADAGNYIRNNERADFLYARQPIARRLLNDAVEQQTSFGKLRVISTEGLIAFKLQAIVNNPRRTQDLEDIRALLRENQNTVNMSEIREYFRLFEQETLLEQLLHETN